YGSTRANSPPFCASRRAARWRFFWIDALRRIKDKKRFSASAGGETRARPALISTLDPAANRATGPSVEADDATRGPRYSLIAGRKDYALSVRCLAQASATLLSALSSPGMIAQVCFSM